MLHFQDPHDPNGLYLVEAILEACEGAVQGGGAFAFATPAGASLLLNDDVFCSFTTNSKFTLVLGIDAVTNREALTVVRESVSRSRGLRAFAYFNSGVGGMFHPKTCWFRTREGGRLIVGSGNLTMGGLRNNWEAFAISNLDTTGVKQVVKVWDNWVERHTSSLLPLDDPKVLERASRNDNWVQFVEEDELTLSPKQGSAGNVQSRKDVHTSLDVLIAEIPKSGVRWNQANFDQENYEDFFQARVGTQRRIILQHIHADGSLGRFESRPSVQVRSHNYRFELEAGAGLEYPTQGRPIGVFLRVAARSFRYRLLMPHDGHYSNVRDFLFRNWDGRQDRMRRVRCSVDTIVDQLPSLANDIGIASI